MLLSLLVLAAFTPHAVAEEPSKDRMVLTIRSEPETLEPGSQGTLVVEGVLPEKLHIYAEATNGNEPMAWTPIPAQGVVYDVEGASLTLPHDFQDPWFPDEPPYPVYEGTITLRLPITIGDAVPAGTRVGVSFSYTGCDDQQCYPRIEQHEVALAVGGGEPAPPPAGVPADPEPPAGPAVTPAFVGNAGTTVSVRLSEEEDALIVRFEPPFGWHLYLPGSFDGIPIEVTPLKAEGVTWGKFDLPAGDHLGEPLEVTVPFERSADAKLVQVRVGWQACSDGEEGRCGGPESEVFGATWSDASLVATPEKEEIPQGDLAFPVVEGDTFSVGARSEPDQPKGWLALFPIFFVGALLALTPCVLPIIPITVSIVAGNATDMPKSRLFQLLTVFSLGLATTYGVLGLSSAFLGQSISVIFQYPIVLWGFVVFFAAMALSMMGLFEIKPPEFMSKFQGSAQEKGGSMTGAALLGAMMCVLSTPCTGPFVIGMASTAAAMGDPLFGFFMFFALGLGMSSIFFLVAGSLGAFLKPGPWMVWIRYGFAVALYGAAIFYIGNNDLVSPTLQWIIAVAGVVVSWFLVRRHLVHVEGEDGPDATARATALGACVLAGAAVAAIFSRRAAQDLHGLEITASLVLGGLLVLALVLLVRKREAPAPQRLAIATVMAVLGVGLVFTTTQPFDRPPPPEYDIAFTDIESLDHLKELVAESKAAGKGVFMEVSARGCTYCRYYQSLIHNEDSLHEDLNNLTRLHLYLDNSPTEFAEIYDAIGEKRGQRPLLVFWDVEGRLRSGATLAKWLGDDSVRGLKERFELAQTDALPSVESAAR